MLDWEWYNIIPARISLTSSALVMIHILYLFFSGSINLKPFHITSLIMSFLDIIQNLGYAIPVSCHYAVGLLLFGCVSKSIIIPGFIFYLYLLLYHQILDKDLLFWKFVSYCLLSFLIPTTSIIILSNYSDYFNDLCDQGNFSDRIHSPIGHTLNELIFLFTIIIPCTIGYSIFVYFILLVIWKIGYDTLSQIGTRFVYRFTLGLIIFSFGMIPGVYILILYLFNIQSDQIFTQCIKISGVCLCSLGFLYAIFYFLNVPIVVSCLVRVSHPSTNNTSSAPRTKERTTLGELVHQPVLSEPIILSDNYRWSSASPLLPFPIRDSSSSSLSSAPTPKTTRQSELSLVNFSSYEKDSNHRFRDDLLPVK
jgi:hypothetical protein